MWSYKEAYINIPDRNDKYLCDLVKKLESRKQFWWNKFIEYNAIFIHIPRNGGTSIESFYGVLEPTSQHFTAREIRLDDPDKFDTMFKFAVIRDPYDRLLSSYCYLKAGGNKKGLDSYWQEKIEQLGSFKHFVENFLIDPIWSSLPSHFVPQYMFVCDEDESIVVNQIIPFEQLQENGISMLGISRFGESNVPRLRSSIRSIEEGYDKDGVIASIVYKAYSKDFDIFHSDSTSWKNLISKHEK